MSKWAIILSLLIVSLYTMKSKYDTGEFFWDTRSRAIVEAGQRTSNSPGLLKNPVFQSPGYVSSTMAPDRSSLLTVKTAEGTDYLIKFISLIDETRYFSVFVRGGQILTITVPTGRFVGKYAQGLTWYGEQDLFGSDTSVTRFQNPINFDFGSELTITLTKSVDGNLPVSRIPRNQF